MKCQTCSERWTIECTARRWICSWNKKMMKENKSTILILSGRCTWNSFTRALISRRSTILFVRYSVDHGRERLSSFSDQVIDQKKDIERHDKVWIQRVDRNSDSSCRVLLNKDSRADQINFSSYRKRNGKTDSWNRSLKNIRNNNEPIFIIWWTNQKIDCIFQIIWKETMIKLGRKILCSRISNNHAHVVRFYKKIRMNDWKYHTGQICWSNFKHYWIRTRKTMCKRYLWEVQTKRKESMTRTAWKNKEEIPIQKNIWVNKYCFYSPNVLNNIVMCYVLHIMTIRRTLKNVFIFSYIHTWNKKSQSQNSTQTSSSCRNGWSF